MKTLLPIVFCFILFNVYSQNTSNTITGIISHLDYPLVNAHIAIKGTSIGTESGMNGKYEIEAGPRDVLVFSYVGMQTFEIVVEDVTRVLNINMVRKVEKLDEVVLTKRKKMTQKTMAIEFPINTNIIKTGYGYINKDATALYLRTLDGEDLNTASIDLIQALKGKFAGLVAENWYDSGTGRTEPVMYIRRKGRIIFEVDGMVYTSVPNWLDINTIERIGLITGSIAARKWGNGAAGIMIINTTAVKNALTEEGTNLPYDRAKLRDNFFKDDALSQAAVLKNETLYVKELYQSKNMEEALAIYDKYRGNYGDSFYFVLDIYRFFMERFEERGVANDIISAQEEVFSENPLALKALAYIHQSNGDFKKANELYKEIFILRPNYGQSFMDLANSYRDIGDGKKAASLYMRYDYLLNEGFLVNDSTAFSNIMDRELHNLLDLSGRDILSKRDFNKALLEEDLSGTRIVFEWNDSEAEFELQFVNPEGRYFKSEHSLAADADRIQEEKLIGYSCEEFVIDASLPGTWQVNVQYLGNKSLTPSYLKAAIYHDYGSAAQRKEIKVFKLGLKNVNQELFKVNKTPTITSN